MNRLSYDPSVPRLVQRDGWSCLAKSITWSFASLGLFLPDRDVERRVRAWNITSPGGYLTDKTGLDLAGWTEEQFPQLGVSAQYRRDASWEEVRHDAGRFPLIIGGSIFLHYTAVRDYDPFSGLLLLANSSDGWRGVGQVMSRAQFERQRPLVAIRITTPEMLEEGGRDVPDGVQHARAGRACQALVVGSKTLYLPRSTLRLDAPGVPTAGRAG
jgi:hypothetical protein